MNTCDYQKVSIQEIRRSIIDLRHRPSKPTRIYRLTWVLKSQVFTRTEATIKSISAKQRVCRSQAWILERRGRIRGSRRSRSWTWVIWKPTLPPISPRGVGHRLCPPVLKPHGLKSPWKWQLDLLSKNFWRWPIYITGSTRLCYA